MAGRIEDYAVIGNCETLALVGRDGSIDWLCAPRFDSDACFAALLGGPEHGRWLIGPRDPGVESERRYRDGTLVLETEFRGPDGIVRITDCMLRADGACDIVRQVTGVAGRLAMRVELVVRFGYGAVTPWTTRLDDGRLCLIAGPDRIMLATPIELHGEDMRSVGEFDVAAGDELSFVLNWTPSHRTAADALDGPAAIARSTQFWRDWSSQHVGGGEWSGAVERSLLTLKALTHFDYGGIVAAGTTSLPEQVGGSRNWDYRFCWLRDSTLTLHALMGAGFTDEAQAWGRWLLRAIAGSADQLQIMYGVAGERRLTEYEIDWLPGYEASRPIRIGNAASGQLQLDVYGEVIDSLYQGRQMGIDGDEAAWRLQVNIVEHLETIWTEPDDGIWEVRGERRHFTHSKVMAWVAFDRAVRSIEEFGLSGPLERWRAVRDQIHAQVCEHGYNAQVGAFVQFYGSDNLDASLLTLPLVGFLPATDPRMAGTIAAIESRLLVDGFVRRYDTGSSSVDGLPSGEGAFLACSFWLADNYLLLGRVDDARALFERLLALRNDVGLLAEEYDPVAKRQVGNFPQAFSHIALINTARNLDSARNLDRALAATPPASGG